MTISVKVGELRNHLSAYLGRVRKGAEVVITDRETPIGRLIPFDRKGADEDFKLIPPPKGYKGLAKLSFPPCKPFAGAVDELLRDRRKR